MPQRINPDRRRNPRPSEPRLIRVSSFPEPPTPVPHTERPAAPKTTRRPADRKVVRSRAWTGDEDRYLRKHYARDGLRSCAEHLERIPSNVGKRVRSLGLRSKRSRAWTTKEDLLLRQAVSACDS